MVFEFLLSISEDPLKLFRRVDEDLAHYLLSETQAKGNSRLPVEIMSQADMTCSARQRVFQEALRKGNTKELHSLLQNMTNCEFNVNSFGPEGQTALHQSVIDGNLELVKLLVKFGADIRLANRDGWSALHIAAFGGHQDIVLYLITRAKYSSSAL